MNRRCFLQTVTAGALSAATRSIHHTAAEPPNIVLILADDLGYGDLGCYGSRISTPNLDRLAGQGAMLRQFSVASAVCSPSRAGLLTGKYPVRVGVPGVFSPQDTTGLRLSEVTMAQMLKRAGYATSCIGKWHLGSLTQYLPTSRGFDEYFGMPCSNDQAPTLLLNNCDIVEQRAKLETLTQRYTDRAVNFIRRSKDSPFFLYMAHWAPHPPLAVSPSFRGKSHLGLYGDVIAEMDWSIGQVLEALRENGVDENTLVIFTSDNGPWFQGSAGDLRGRKGESFEGGIREPFIARWPRRIPTAREVTGFASALDLLPTIAALAGTAPPPNLDGVDIAPMLTGLATEVARPPFLYFDAWNLQCARVGGWKLHMARYNTPPWLPSPSIGRFNLRLLSPELYDLYDDPGEGADCADDNPAIVAQIQQQVAAMLPSFPVEVQRAWADTQSRPVYPTASGAWPVPIT
jgi:arylsulfatase A